MSRAVDVIRLNSLITRLLADGGSFDGKAADELIAILPVNSPRRRWSLSGALRVGDRRHGPPRLVTAGAPGRASGDADQRWVNIDTSGGWMHVGMYKVQHQPGVIRFRSATPAGDVNGHGQALLLYDRRGCATRMKCSHVRGLTVFRLHFDLVTFRPWKFRA